MRIFNTRGVNYWFDTFKHLESFDVLTTSEILDLYTDILVQVDKLDGPVVKSTKFTDNCGFGGSKRNYWDVGFFGKDDLKFPEVDTFYKSGGGVVGETELSLESNDDFKLLFTPTGQSDKQRGFRFNLNHTSNIHLKKQKGFKFGLNHDELLDYVASQHEANDKFIYLKIPYEFFDDFMTTSQLPDDSYVNSEIYDNDIKKCLPSEYGFNLLKMKEFINEVESTEMGWKPSNFIPILNKYDKKYPALLKYIGDSTDKSAYHYKWRYRFSTLFYISIKDLGLAFPLWTQTNNNIFYDGIHRVVGTFLTKSDIPVFIKIDDDEFSVITPPLFNGYKCKMNIEVYNKKVSFLIDENVVGIMNG